MARLFHIYLTNSFFDLTFENKGQSILRQRNKIFYYQMSLWNNFVLI
jgi:hypothetical protein